jgi:hypothetical protein
MCAVLLPPGINQMCAVLLPPGINQMCAVLLPPGINQMCALLLPPGVNPIAVKCIYVYVYKCIHHILRHIISAPSTAELGYTVMKRPECLVSLQNGVV